MPKRARSRGSTASDCRCRRTFCSCGGLSVDLLGAAVGYAAARRQVRGHEVVSCMRLSVFDDDALRVIALLAFESAPIMICLIRLNAREQHRGPALRTGHPHDGICVACWYLVMIA